MPTEEEVIDSIYSLEEAKKKKMYKEKYYEEWEKPIWVSFSFDRGYRKHLTTGVVSNGLRRIFKEHQHPLPPGARLSKSQGEWFVEVGEKVGGEVKYKIKDESNKIVVYKKWDVSRKTMQRRAEDLPSEKVGVWRSDLEKEEEVKEYGRRKEYWYNKQKSDLSKTGTKEVMTGPQKVKTQIFPRPEDEKRESKKRQ